MKLGTLEDFLATGISLKEEVVCPYSGSYGIIIGRTSDEIGVYILWEDGLVLYYENRPMDYEKTGRTIDIRYIFEDLAKHKKEAYKQKVLA